MPSRVYVGTYAKYNSGSIAGAWLDLEDYPDSGEFYEACAELHADEADPEFMFQDWEDIPEGMISESNIDDDAFELAAMPDDDRELWTVYRAEVDSSGTLEQARESFQGKSDTKADFAEQWYEDGGYGVPDYLQGYIDWESVARDMGDITFVRHDGDVWAFRNL